MPAADLSTLRISQRDRECSATGKFAEALQLSSQAHDHATKRKYYKEVRMAHDAADQLLRRKLPASPKTRAESGAAIREAGLTIKPMATAPAH